MELVNVCCFQQPPTKNFVERKLPTEIITASLNRINPEKFTKTEISFSKKQMLKIKLKKTDKNLKKKKKKKRPSGGVKLVLRSH
jgi:hypothetical protein